MGPESRTYIDENNKCVWGDNEKIYVTSKDGKTTGVLSLTQKSEDGTSATFSGFVFGDPADLYYSVYPVPENGVINITHIDGANHNAPMAGVISNGSVAFDYACGLVRMEVVGADAMEISVVPTADNTKKQIAGGSYTFNPETGEWNFTEGEGITVSIPENDIVYIPVYGTETKQEATLTASLKLSDGTTKDSEDYPIQVVEDGLDASSVPALKLSTDGTITETTYFIASAEDLDDFAEKVDKGNTFEGKTVKLLTDIDLSNRSWNPIGDNRTKMVFSGTFDGQNHTIKGASKSSFDGSNYGSKEGWGLFSVVDRARIKNVNIDNATFGSYTVISGTVAGYAYDTTFEYINITNTKIAGYNWYTGGVVGWAGGECTFKVINLDSTTAVGTLWDSHGQCAGGIAGGVSSSETTKIAIEDCNIACVLDVINDVTSNYKWWIYRVSGMIIGNISKTQEINGRNYANPTNVTCKNVTVTYGDWMNYHYCQGYWNRGWGRVESSDYVDGIDHTQCNHPDGEQHYVCVPFNQLFGGGPNGNGRSPVYGLAEYPGVNVNYPESYIQEVATISDITKTKEGTKKINTSF